MLIKSILPAVFAAAFLLSGASLTAQSGHGHDHGKAKAEAAAGKLVPAADVDAAWLEKARKAYPLNACLTSDEKLGSMGKPSEWVYRVSGKADRLVVFCCEGCGDDFLKEPATYIAKLDQAVAAKSGK